MKPPRYEHIIWDWNGTLLNDLELTLELVNAELAHSGLEPIDLSSHRTLLEFPISRYYEKLGINLTHRPMEKINDAFHARYMERFHICSLHLEARKVLERLFQSGIKQHILSAYNHDHLTHLTRHFAIDDFFENVLGLSSAPGSSKAALGNALMKKIGNSKSTVMIGDTLHDAEVATSMGCHCVLVSHGHNTKEVLGQSGRPIFNSLLEFANYLSG